MTLFLMAERHPAGSMASRHVRRSRASIGRNAAVVFRFESALERGRGRADSTLDSVWSHVSLLTTRATEVRALSGAPWHAARLCRRLPSAQTLPDTWSNDGWRRRLPCSDCPGRRVYPARSVAGRLLCETARRSRRRSLSVHAARFGGTGETGERRRTIFARCARKAQPAPAKEFRSTISCRADALAAWTTASCSTRCAANSLSVQRGRCRTTPLLTTAGIRSAPSFRCDCTGHSCPGELVRVGAF